MSQFFYREIRMNEGSTDSMLSFEEDTLYWKPRGKFIFTMPRVVPDQRVTFENDELFRKLSRESEVKYTGFRDRPIEERQLRFQAECREGKADLAFVPTGTNLTMSFSPNSWSDRPEDRIPTREFVDFDLEQGKVHLKSQFILNGVCVVWMGWVDLVRLDGVGCLAFDEERAQVEDSMLRDQIEQNNRRVQEFEERRRQHQQEQERQAASEAEAIRRKHRHRTVLCHSIALFNNKASSMCRSITCNRCISVSVSHNINDHNTIINERERERDRANKSRQSNSRCSSSSSNSNANKDDKHGVDNRRRHHHRHHHQQHHRRCSGDDENKTKRCDSDSSVRGCHDEGDNNENTIILNRSISVTSSGGGSNIERSSSRNSNGGEKVLRDEENKYRIKKENDREDEEISVTSHRTSSPRDSGTDNKEQPQDLSPSHREDPDPGDEDMDVEIEVKSEGEPEQEIEVEIIDDIEEDPPKSPEKPRKSETFWSPWK